METLQKMETNVHAAQEKTASVQKKILLGLQLDMASFHVAKSLSLWPRLCRKHFGTDASRGEQKRMDDLVDVCM